MVSTYFQKKLYWITTQKDSTRQVAKTLKLWGEKAIARLAIFLSFEV